MARYASVTFGIGLFTSIVSASADQNAQCRIMVGACPIEASTSGADCFCTTEFGPLAGKITANAAAGQQNLFDDYRQLPKKYITVEIFSTTQSRTSLDLWASALASNVNVINAVSKNMQVLHDEPLSAVFYSTDIPECVVRVFVASLLQAGIGIRSIEPYQVSPHEGRPPLHYTLQIGRSSKNTSRQILSQDAIASGSLPLYGAPQ